MNVQSIMAELEAKGNEGIKKILLRHGVKEPFFGVKVEYLKVIQKKVKKDYQLAKTFMPRVTPMPCILRGLLPMKIK